MLAPIELSEIHVGIGALRIEVEGAPVVAFGPLQISSVTEHVAQTVSQNSILLDGQKALINGLGLVEQPQIVIGKSQLTLDSNIFRVVGGGLLDNRKYRLPFGLRRTLRQREHGGQAGPIHIPLFLQGGEHLSRRCGFGPMRHHRQHNGKHNHQRQGSHVHQPGTTPARPACAFRRPGRRTGLPGYSALLS